MKPEYSNRFSCTIQPERNEAILTFFSACPVYDENLAIIGEEMLEVSKIITPYQHLLQMQQVISDLLKNYENPQTNN